MGHWGASAVVLAQRKACGIASLLYERLRQRDALAFAESDVGASAVAQRGFPRQLQQEWLAAQRTVSPGGTAFMVSRLVLLRRTKLRVASPFGEATGVMGHWAWVKRRFTMK
ncbi:MAG: hypothetical protein V7L29_28965 [Nostoc sp.]|uniref:hypothetical protein n=1 Tax=Nostoc sp. TaxID=1180 RepID=UPI002FF5BBA5